MLNTKLNQSRQSDRGKSVGGKFHQLNGVRYFQTKFFDSLNKPSLNQTNSILKNPSQIKLQQPIYKQSAQTIQNKYKQNINPIYSNYNRKSNEIIVKKQQQKIRICYIKGLNNIGNTCYMNSILQCLLNLSKFNSNFYDEITKIKNKRLQVALEYYSLLQSFYQNSNNTITPSKFKSAIGKKKCRFLGSAQQDAQQLLTAFLQTVNQETSRISEKPKYVELQNNPNKRSIKTLSQEWWQYYKKRDDSIICDNFQGQILSTVTCSKCNNSSVTFDNIWGLPLSLPKMANSISQLIKKNWTIDSQITDYYCSKCQKNRVCMKKLQFFRLPQNLVIQLKRFQYGRWNKEKIKTSVKLSDTLNLSQFLSGYAQIQNSNYRLNSIVHHYGQIDYGHYTASVYKQKQKKWFLCNDSKTSESVPDGSSNTVYLLFYEKINK